MRRVAATALGTLILALLTAAPLAAQSAEPAPPPLTREQIVTYAKAYLAVSAARDAVHLELAQARNKTPEAQKQLQQRLRDEIARVLREHGFSDEDYRRATYVISADPAQRKQFDEIVAELTKT